MLRLFSPSVSDVGGFAAHLAVGVVQLGEDLRLGKLFAVVVEAHGAGDLREEARPGAAAR